MLDRNEAPGLSPKNFRAIAHHLVDRIADFYERLPELPVARNEPADAGVRALGDRSLPEDPSSVEESLETLFETLMQHSVHTGHPGFLAYIVGAASPLGVLADFAATAMNPLVTTFKTAPAASAFERQSVRWLAELLGFPSGADGIFLSGGTMANLAGIHVARERRAAGHKGVRLYATHEVHSWLRKAVSMLGLGDDSITWVEVDSSNRMRVDDLISKVGHDLAKGKKPLAVIATCGTTSTGAVDPIRAISRFCLERGVWLHVDGAYGGFAAACPDAAPELSDDLRAIASADSLAVDPHKWMYVPLEAGCLLVKEPGSLYKTFFRDAPYYSHMPQSGSKSPGGISFPPFRDQGPQTSRGARALKVWLTLKVLGRKQYAEKVRSDIELADLLARKVLESPELELVSKSLSIVTFRYVPAGLDPGKDGSSAYLDELNHRVLERIQEGGELYPSHSIVNGKFVLRACIVNFRTTQDQIFALRDLALELGRALHAESGQPV